MDRRIVARFFRVEAERGSTPATDVLRTVASLPIAACFKTIGSFGVRMERLRERGLLSGDFVRLQTENIPGAAGPDTQQQPLGLPDGHGLAHCAAFAYDPSRSILALQANRNGLGPGTFAGYLGDLAPRPGSKYRVVPILKSDAMRRLREMRPSKFEVRVATPDDLRPLDDEQSTVRRSLIGMKEVAGGNTVEITVSAGRRRTPLRANHVRRVVRWLSEQAHAGRGGIEMLKVSGLASDEEDAATVALDLLKEVLQTSEELTFPNNDVDRSYDVRRAFVERAFREHDEELGTLFRRDGS